MTAVEPIVDETEPQTFTSRQVTRMTGATYRQLDYWVRCGLIPNDTAQGSGSQRTFTVDELETVYFAVGLRRAGFTMRASLLIAGDLVDGSAYDVTVSTVVRVHVDIPIRDKQSPTEPREDTTA